MKVVSIIEQPSVIKGILKHLDLWKDGSFWRMSLAVSCRNCSNKRDDVPEIEVG